MTIQLLLATLASLSLQQASDQGVEGRWEGVADQAPDSGLPVTLRLKISRHGDSLRVALSLPESHLIDLALPSPYSDSSYASLQNGRLHAEFTPDIGLGFIGRLVPRDEERIIFDGARVGAELHGAIQITRYRSPIRLRRMPESHAREPAITFHSEADSLRLGGNLVLPAGAGPFPAVVFVTGSDPDTREMWQFEARALAARGVGTISPAMSPGRSRTSAPAPISSTVVASA